MELWCVFYCSSLNKSPDEPNDINKTWLIQFSGGNSSVPQIRVRNRFFSKFSTKKYVVCTQNNRLDDMVLLSTQNTCLN